MPPKSRGMYQSIVQRQRNPGPTPSAVAFDGIDGLVEPHHLVDATTSPPMMMRRSVANGLIDVDTLADGANIVGSIASAQDVEHDLDDAWMKPTDGRVTSVPPPGIDDDDLMRIYMNEMGQYGRLTAAEEVALAQKIEETQRVRNRKLLGGLEDIRMQVGDLPVADPPGWVADLTPEAARVHMIRANLRLVVSIAKQSVGRGLSLLDLIQEGNIGLMKAVDRFDWRRGCRFGTYASWWVKQAIGRAIGDQGRLIRIPAHMSDSLGRVQRLRQSWFQMHEVEPTTAELSTLAHVSQDRIERMEQLAAPPVSIDWLLSDGERTVGDLLPDDSTMPPLDLLLECESNRLLQEALGDLTPRERRILRMHFGLGYRRSYTLEEIGRTFHLTRERIRQIEVQALKKLRQPERRRKLEDLTATPATPEPMAYGVEISIDAGY